MTFRPARLLLTSLVLGLTASVLGVIPLAGASAPSSTAPPARVDDLFTPLEGLSLAGDRVRVRPDSFAAFTVDVPGVRDQLSQGGLTTIELPAPTGEPVEFKVTESSVMEPGLQARHPEIRTYAGVATDGSARSVRVGTTPMGLFASVRGDRSTWYIDPAFVGRGETRHVSYFDAAVPDSDQPIKQLPPLPVPGADSEGPQQLGPPNGPVTQKDYRLALVTDPSYATYFGAANVSAEKAMLVNRVNQVYMDDMAIQFLLVANNDLLNLNTAQLATAEDGPCGANPCFTQEQLDDGCGGVLDRNTFVIGQIIGAENYDVGHIGLGTNGGGVAYLGSVGNGGVKGGGCTGLPFPEGDFFAIDYVAHEIGHQMGANHTFNGTEGACFGPNRNFDPYTTQVEPGSGSTVMAYAGICDQDDLQPHTDPYFSFVSIEEIAATVADDTSTNDEQQVVNLKDFDGTDAFTISCAGCATSSPVVNGTTYNKIGLSQAISEATGETVSAAEVADYDSGGFPSPTAPSEAGFTVDFTLAAAGTDIPTLVITPTAGSFTYRFTGTIIQGGETTNEGTDSTLVNTNPIVTAPADKTIPTRTPFTLTGSATDANGDPLIYLWEQTDPGGATGTSLVDNNKLEGPLFRVFGVFADVSLAESLQSPSPDQNLATGDPSRTFPDLAQVLAGTTNAATGSCPPPPPAPEPLPLPVLDCYSEFLPTQAYATTSDSMVFRLSARDQRPIGGGYAFDDVELTVDPSAGPFLVTSQATKGASALPGSSQTVTWAVNGTNAAGLAPNVRISLSLDGGKTFPTELVASTPNDGSQTVTMPQVEAAAARIKVEAVGNYFFDVNDASFAIGVTPNTTITEGPAPKSFVLTRKARFSMTSTTPGSTFVCTLDGKSVPCTATTKVKYKPGTHVFGVAARSSTGILDPTPATRVFASPFNDGQLTRRTKGWKRIKDKASYRGAYMVTSSKDQVLTRKARKISKVALVAHTGPGFGRVAVLFKGKTLRVIDLSSQSLNKKVLIKVARFKGKRSGTFSIRTLDNKPVRIDGLGLLAKIKT